MCGRFGLFAELDALAEQFNFDPSIMHDIYSPRWNIPPTVPVLAVQPSSSEVQSGRNTASLMRWGMTGARNPRTKGSSRPLFNARAETVHRLPSFRQPFKERRCLVPASGFYEWRKDESGRRTPICSIARTALLWRSPESGLRNGQPTETSMPAPSSPARRTTLPRPSTSGCPSSCRPKPMANGSARIQMQELR